MANVPIESSFAQILNRTQQNLNRINQRYAPPPNNPTGSTATSVSLFSLQDSNPLLRDRLAGKDLTNISNTYRPSSSISKTATNSISINEDLLRDILERITTLESKKGEEQSVIQRVERLEKLLSNHDSGLDHLIYESKDLQRQTSHLQSRISNMEMLYESNKSEHESRRATNAKIDHWIKDQDHWRDDIDRLTTQLRKEMADFKHDKQDYQQRFQQVATKQDIEQVKDKIHLLTQQSVSVAISAWTETADHKIRQLERELALLKMGQSSAVQKEISEKTGGLIPDDSGSEHAATAEMIAKALDAPTPSETLVKGMVAAEILQMQTSLENKLDRQLQHNLTSALVDAKRALASQFEQQILAIGLMESVGPIAFNIDTSDSFPSSTSPTTGIADADIARLRREFDRRVMSGKSKLDQLEKQLQDRVTNLSETLYRLQNSYETSDKTNTASLALLQQRLEAVVHQNESLLQTSLSRSQHHEQMLQQLDEKIGHQLRVKSEETYQRLQETVQDFQETRLLLERRLLPLEQSARDWLHELRHQQDRIMTSITSHPAFVEATRIVSNLDVVTKEVRENSANLLKLQAQVCWQKDYVALNEKVSRMDHIVHQKSPEYFALTTKLLDTTQQLTGRVQQLEHSSQTLLSETDSQRRRMESAETTSLQTLSRVNVLHEELQLTKQRLENHEQAYQRDHTTIKDLAGSVATRVQSVEGKTHILQRTQEAEVNALRQQIKMADEKVVHLDQSFQTFLINMTFQKEKVPPAIPVADEKVLIVSKPPSIEEKLIDEESYERILTPRKQTTVTNFETSPLSEEKAQPIVKSTSRTHMVDIIFDHPVEKMFTLPSSTHENMAINGDDSDESSVASSEDEKYLDLQANKANNPSQSMSKYDRSESSDDDDDDDDRDQDNSDAQRIEARTSDVDKSAVVTNVVSFVNKYDEDDSEDNSDEDDDNQSISDHEQDHPIYTNQSNSAIKESNNAMEDSTSSFFSDNYSPSPVKSVTAQFVEKPNTAVMAPEPPTSTNKANTSSADIEEFDADAFDDSHSSMSLASPAGQQHPMSSSVLSPAISKSTVFTNSNIFLQQQTPQHNANDASFSDWDASMDEESSRGLGGSASSPWVKNTTNAVIVDSTKPIQQSDNMKGSLTNPENKWNNYVSDDNSSTSPRDEDNDADGSHQQSHSHLQPEPYSGDQNSSEISSFDRRQISLDISDSSIDDRSSSGKQTQSPSNTAVEKKKPGILEGLSDEDSSDLSYDYHKNQATKTAITSVVSASTIVNALPTVNTGTPALSSGSIPASKPKILEGLSDDESSDGSFLEKKKQQQQKEKESVPEPSLVFTNNTVDREETIFSASSSSATVPPVVPASSAPTASATVPLTASGNSGFVPVVSAAGLTARERLRLRQEQMRAQRTASSSTNVSAVPSAVVSGANSPVHSPASPVNFPRVTSTTTTANTNTNNGIPPVTNRLNNSDGVMSFEDDEFENSFDT